MIDDEGGVVIEDARRDSTRASVDELTKLQEMAGSRVEDSRNQSKQDVRVRRASVSRQSQKSQLDSRHS